MTLPFQIARAMIVRSLSVEASPGSGHGLAACRARGEESIRHYQSLSGVAITNQVRRARESYLAATIESTCMLLFAASSVAVTVT
jgi:hypothetical protein